MKKEFKFPEGFLWGSAVSSYQVEGGIEGCHWSKNFSAGKACDYYNQYEKYFDIAKELNQNVHRLSLEWSRIEPEEGKFDKEAIDHYKEMLKSLKKRNIKTMVTLWHFTLPQWLQEKGGWANKNVSKYFIKYVTFVVEDLKEYVDFWITINEPMIYVSQAYIIKRFPPREKNLIRSVRVIYNFIVAHKKAYEIIKKIDPEKPTGMAENYSYTEPFNKNFLTKRLVLLWDFVRNVMFLELTAKEQDFIGVNYYFHERVRFRFKYPFVFVENANKKTTDLGWEIYPKGLFKVVKKMKKYNKPVYITENGLADKNDKWRKEFIKQHLEWLHKAIEQGVDVRGYLYWSLLDNFEWVDGFSPRFGLVEMNFDTLETKIRPSAFEYAEICKNNKLIV